MWDQARDEYDQVQSGQHEGKLSHEMLAGAGAFAGFAAFEHHQRSEGKTVKHDFAKELLAGFVGGEVDKLVETKGLDWVDTEKAKRHGTEKAERMYDQQYGDMNEYDPDRRGRHEHIRR